MLVPRGQERVRQKQLLRIDPASRDGVRSDMSLLENASVSSGTKESYRRQMGEFMKRESVGNINCHASELDQKLVSHFDRLYLEGKASARDKNCWRRCSSFSRYTVRRDA